MSGEESARNVSGFSRPPVVETAMAVEFSTVPGLTVTDMVHLADKWADRYPARQEQPPLPPSTPTGGGPVLPFGPIGGVRLWCADEERSLLLQLQHDRLILNWRAAGATPQRYPGYQALEAEFALRWGQLASFIEEQGIAAPVPRLAEFTYVNVIEHAGATEVTKALMVMSPEDTQLPGQESTITYATERQVGSASAKNGILAVTANRDASERHWVLTVVTRMMNAESESDPLPLVATAHTYSREAFLATTTSEAQADWGAE